MVSKITLKQVIGSSQVTKVGKLACFRLGLEGVSTGMVSDSKEVSIFRVRRYRKERGCLGHGLSFARRKIPHEFPFPIMSENLHGYVQARTEVHAVVSIRGRQRPGFLNLHLPITTDRFTFTGFRTENFSTTCLAAISFTEISHCISSPITTYEEIYALKKATSSIPLALRSSEAFPRHAG
jgi:hypothetical protein